MSGCEKIRQFAEKRENEWVTFDELSKGVNIEKLLIYDMLRKIDLKKIANFDLGFTIEKKNSGRRSKLIRFVKDPILSVVKVESKPEAEPDIMPHIIAILKAQSESIRMIREDVMAIREQQNTSRDTITRGMLLKLEVIQEKILELSM